MDQKPERFKGSGKIMGIFEMWCWRRLLKVECSDKRMNEWVLEEVREKRTLLQSIKERKKKWLGHVLRHEGLLLECIEGKMEGKRGRGRRRLGMLSELGSKAEVKRLAQDRKKWRNS